MALKKFAKGTGIAVLSLGILAGCSDAETDEGANDEFFNEEELNLWAEENGYVNEDELNTWAEEEGYVNEEDLNTWAEENGLFE